MISLTGHAIRWTTALICCAASVRVFAAGADELNDLAARLQFNYYAADTRALQQNLRDITNLSLSADLTRTRDYQLGYGQWKLAETIQPKDKPASRRAADACIEATDKALDAVPKRANIVRPDVLHAELHAIQSGCYATRGDVSRATKLLEDARALQSGNPRILLVTAALAIGRAKSAADRAAAEGSIAAAVAAFDAQPPLPPGSADWGHAEALARLGEIQLLQGNRVAARNSIERALVMAPDYSFARALLARTTGSR